MFVTIDGYENYEVNRKGVVRNKLTGKTLKWQDDGAGYAFVCLYAKGKKKKNYKIHRLVGKYFVPNPHNLEEVDHIDKNRWNNEDTNLRWASKQDNMAHRWNKLKVA